MAEVSLGRPRSRTRPGLGAKTDDVAGAKARAGSGAGPEPGPEPGSEPELGAAAKAATRTEAVVSGLRTGVWTADTGSQGQEGFEWPRRR